ncbi:MAG: TRAP transporter large permease subunit [Bacteroidota bacterium]
MEVIALIMFVLIFVLILAGVQVAFVLGGLSAIVGMLFVPDFLDLLPLRIMGVMRNQVLIAVPLFIYMGLMLEKSGLAQNMLVAMARLMGNRRGGLALSVVIVGALLAASTGIVGATVVTMGLISLPAMLEQKYDKGLACGTIASAGTLGQIIPPSVVLVLLGSVLSVSVGDLFRAALTPGLILVGAYIAYILIISRMYPSMAPQYNPVDDELQISTTDAAFAFMLPFGLMVAVLGSIFAGIASPTEAAAVGALGACILTLLRRKFTLSILQEVMRETTRLTSMVFLILLGATTFSLVFKGLDGDQYLIELIQQSNLEPMVFLAVVMIGVFILGFFIDFIEIIFIVVPVVAPVFVNYEMDLIWIGILLALNLQTSFLTPPFGFSLFYLKGVAPDSVKTTDIYRGVLPFLAIQIVLLVVVVLKPNWIGVV